MKPSAFRLLVLVVTFGLFAALWTPAAAEPTYHFDPQQYQGASLTYYLVTTGTLDVLDETGPPVSVSFEFSSLLTAAVSADASGADLPFELTLSTPALRGVTDPTAPPVEPVTLRGRLSRAGVLRQIETPPFLAALGIDMADLLIGLFVPAPEPSRVVSPGVEWRATFDRELVDRDRPGSLSVTVTYTVSRPVDWRNQPLQSVTARVRGDRTLREGLYRTEVQEIGHGLLYLRENGIVELSSVSVITQLETRMPSLRVPISQSKLTLTTTLELREGGPVAPTPAAPVPVAPAPASPAPAAPATPPAEPVAPEQLVEPLLPEQPAGGTGTEPLSSEVQPPAVEAEPSVEEPSPAKEPAAKPESLVEPTRPVEPVTEPTTPVESTSTVEPVLVTEPATEEAREPAVAEAPVEAPMEPAGAAVEPEPPTRSNVYRDPAGRFELALGDEWIPTPRSISLRGTTFVAQDGQERAYVYVMPLPSPAATALAIARSALATYGETQTSFRILVEPEADLLDGEIAYRAKYTYLLGGERITEWALFARRRDRAYYVQYARVGEPTENEARDLAKLYALRDGFRFGDFPRGNVPVRQLRESLSPYLDPAGRFQLLVPRMWPLTERADDGSSTIFTEIGENGQLTILVQPGARGLAASQIVSVWKDQAAQEEGFRLLLDVTPVTMGGYPGARFDYAWSGGASGDWARRLQAVVVDDTFVAIAVDYIESGYAERSAVIDEILASFTVFEEPVVQPGGEAAGPLKPETLVGPTKSTEAAAASESAERAGAGDLAGPAEPAGPPGAAGPFAPELPSPPDEADVDTSPGLQTSAEQAPASAPEVAERPTDQPAPRMIPVEEFPFAEPVGDDTVLLLGRILTRYPGPGGKMEEAWAKGLEVTVFAEQDEFRGVTDDLGYLYVANLPRLAPGRLYTVSRLDGPMLGFVEPVAVSFDNLRIGQIGPRVAHLRTIILTLNPDRTLSVEIVRATASAPEDPSALAYFVMTYPNSAWAPHVEEVLRAGLD